MNNPIRRFVNTLKGTAKYLVEHKDLLSVLLSLLALFTSGATFFVTNWTSHEVKYIVLHKQPQVTLLFANTGEHTEIITNVSLTEGNCFDGEPGIYRDRNKVSGAPIIIKAHEYAVISLPYEREKLLIGANAMYFDKTRALGRATEYPLHDPELIAVISYVGAGGEIVDTCHPVGKFLHKSKSSEFTDIDLPLLREPYVTLFRRFLLP